MATYTVEIDDTFGARDALVAPTGYGVEAFDTTGFVDLFRPVGQGVVGVAHIGLVDIELSSQYQAGALASGKLGLLDNLTVKSTLHVSLVQILGLVDKLTQQLPVAIVDSLGFTGLLHVARAVIVMEKLGLLDRLIGNDVTQLKMIETLALSDAILDFFGLGGSETFGLSGVFTASFQFNRVLSATIGLEPTLSESALFMRVVTDNAGFEDIDSPSMIYNQTLLDCVDFSIGFIDPGTGEFTSWAVNTRTNAVSEYQNYQFNSFCQIGSNYYGANSDGLWLLNAQTDDGANIPTNIKGAMLSLGGSRYTQLDGVYIGMRVDDDARDFILKLILPAQGIGGTDKTYLYKFNPKNLRTTKVNIGKGLRSRYIQWELITPGPDFDLDSIEFVPVISKRRVS